MKKLKLILLVLILLTAPSAFSQDTSDRYDIENITVLGDSLYCVDSAGLLTVANMKLAYKKNKKALSALEELKRIDAVDKAVYKKVHKQLLREQKSLKRAIKREKRQSFGLGVGIGFITGAILVTINAN